MREFTLDRALTRTAIHGLGKLGPLRYYPDLPSPFFRVTCACGTQIKGVEGTNRIRAAFDRPPTPAMIEDLARSIEEASETTGSRRAPRGESRKKRAS